MKPAADRTELRNLARVLCALAALSPALPVSAAEKAVIATPSRGLFEFPVVVAMRKGFFKDEGIDVAKIQMQPAVGVQALPPFAV